MKVVTGQVLLALCMVSALGFTPSGAHASRPRSVPTQKCVFDHMMLRSKGSTCRPRAKSYPPAVRTAAERAVYDSALTFGIPYSVLLNIAECESSLNPRASNGTHFGLFQFAPDTFAQAAVQLRQATGVIARTYWNALDSSYVAGFMFATGAAQRWACEPQLS
jgi:hypothetical protein